MDKDNRLQRYSHQVRSLLEVLQGSLVVLRDKLAAL